VRHHVENGQLHNDGHLFGTFDFVVFDVATEDLLLSELVNLEDLFRVVVEELHIRQESLELDLGRDASRTRLEDTDRKDPIRKALKQSKTYEILQELLNQSQLVNFYFQPLKHLMFFSLDSKLNLLHFQENYLCSLITTVFCRLTIVLKVRYEIT
jgi:hypothetical protein